MSVGLCLCVRLDKDQFGENELKGEFRCPYCNLMVKSKPALELHVHGRTGRWVVKACKPKPRQYTGTRVDILVKRMKQEEAFKALRPVYMDGEALKMTSYAKLLGRTFESDGGCDRDVEEKCAVASKRWSELRSFWRDGQLRTELKSKIFIQDVFSRIA